LGCNWFKRIREFGTPLVHKEQRATDATGTREAETMGRNCYIRSRELGTQLIIMKQENLERIWYSSSSDLETHMIYMKQRPWDESDHFLCIGMQLYVPISWIRQITNILPNNYVHLLNTLLWCLLLSNSKFA
jgi:hypothetical protein